MLIDRSTLVSIWPTPDVLDYGRGLASRLRRSQLRILLPSEPQQKAPPRLARLPRQCDGRDLLSARPHVEKNLVVGNGPTNESRMLPGILRREFFQDTVGRSHGILLPRSQDGTKSSWRAEDIGDADHTALTREVSERRNCSTEPIATQLLLHAFRVVDGDIGECASPRGEGVFRVRCAHVTQGQDVSRSWVGCSRRGRDTNRSDQTGKPKNKLRLGSRAHRSSLATRRGKCKIAALATYYEPGFGKGEA
jgi:hypothetical protein